MFQINQLRVGSILDIPALTIEPQTITCINGESGSGKSTFLRLLNRMISPDTGTINYQGTPLEEIDPVTLRRQVVMMSQEPLLFPGSIADNLQMGLRFSEKPDASGTELAEMLRFVKLQQPLDKDPFKLSGGEKQRLALGRVLLMNPDVLLLDEPSASLDDETESFVLQRVVERVHQQQKTLLLVTHSKTLAASMGEKHLVFAHGTPRDVTGGISHE
ncbi:ABC transporter ATP-binding protein [Anoxynatronum buryatiense]|uniref:ABC transport system ATP-binding protein n=1 Tax=Anoxynatronum buryatiense TaxID=489973 RepID=A0AA45WX86_9CLOT|nr:ATP-binding cassette domain-containing protein [Anoxynatronum buryatiense]SMP62761.1 putative ABC transport system ATP-binding protein [Anoxynatronum buryatiense]